MFVTQENTFILGKPQLFRITTLQQHQKNKPKNLTLFKNSILGLNPNSLFYTKPSPTQ